MSNYICQSCRSSLLRAVSRVPKRSATHSVIRNYSSRTPREPQEEFQFQANSKLPPALSETHDDLTDSRVDINALLATPSWSVRSLLPEPDALLPPEDEITKKKLHHLLRLSALPLPKDEEEERSMLATLRSQLHFVRDIQNVNTDGVKPLQSIRDETDEGIREITISMANLKEAFGKEELRGRNRRPRRRRVEGNSKRVAGVEDWDPLSTAREIVERGGGRYFVVRSGKGSHGMLLSPQPEDSEVRPHGILQEFPTTLTNISRQEDLLEQQGRGSEAAKSHHIEDTTAASLLGSPLCNDQLSNSITQHEILVAKPNSPDQSDADMLKEQDKLKVDQLEGEALEDCKERIEGNMGAQSAKEQVNSELTKEEHLQIPSIVRFCSPGKWWDIEWQQKLDAATPKPEGKLIRYILPVRIRGQGSPEDSEKRVATQVGMFRRDVASQISELRGRGNEKVSTALSNMEHNPPKDKHLEPIDIEEYLGIQKHGKRYVWKRNHQAQRRK